MLNLKEIEELKKHYGADKLLDLLLAAPEYKPKVVNATLQRMYLRIYVSDEVASKILSIKEPR